MNQGIAVKFEGKDEFLKKIQNVSDPAQRTELFDTFGSYLLSSSQQRFLDETSPDGVAWKKSRRAKDKGGKTLRDSGQLFASLTYRAKSNRVEVGSNKIYAGIHQFGGVIKPKSAKKLVFRVGGGFIFVDKVTMPARPYLGINNQDREELSALATDWMEAALQ